MILPGLLAVRGGVGAGSPPNSWANISVVASGASAFNSASAVDFTGTLTVTLNTALTASGGVLYVYVNTAPAAGTISGSGTSTSVSVTSGDSVFFEYAPGSLVLIRTVTCGNPGALDTFTIEAT